jgi:filamentous hemagglutinin
VVIEAAANTYKESSSSSSETANIGMNSGGTINLGYGQSSSKSNSLDIWYTKSQTMTGEGKINIQSGKDTTVRGANIQGADVELDVSGNLTVESLQDEHHASNSSKGFNVGISVSGVSSLYVPQLGSPMSKDGVGPSFGYNSGKGSSDSAWVNNQTSIVGTNSVDITADKTNMKGAAIANEELVAEEKEIYVAKALDGSLAGILGGEKQTVTEYHWEEKGNVKIKTNEFSSEDIHNYNNSYETGFGIQTNLQINLSGESGPLNNAVDSILYLGGSTTITSKNTGHEMEQETRATVGEGTIIIDGEKQNGDGELIASLNRDITKS